MQSYYEKLKAEKGEAFAKNYMRQLRAKRKENKGGGFNDPKVRAKALEKRKHVQPEKKLLQDSETGQE